MGVLKDELREVGWRDGRRDGSKEDCCRGETGVPASKEGAVYVIRVG